MEDEQIKALSRMVGEQNTTIGYQDAMLARLDAELALARAVCDQLQQDSHDERARVAARRDRDRREVVTVTNERPKKQITWFKTSPDAGDPTCLCSWCEQPIGEHEAPIVRLFDTGTNTEARFHRRCLGESGVMPAIPRDALY